MDIRDLVRIKKGIGGLNPPQNVGILLDRKKSGKDHTAVLFTLKGKMEVKWKHLKETTMSNYQGDKTDEKKMTLVLQDAVRIEQTRKTLKMEPKQILDSIDPEDLWKSVTATMEHDQNHLGKKMEDTPIGCHNLALTPEEIGRIHFDPFFLRPDHVKAVKKVLSRCDDRGDPFFTSMNIRKQTLYFPYKKGTISAVHDHIRKLEGLRSVFLEWVEESTESKRRRRKVPRLKFDDVSDVILGRELQSELDTICGWATFYLENGWWPVEDEAIEFTDLNQTCGFGLAGTPIRRIGKFDLEKYVGYLAMDLTHTNKRYLASSLVTLLMDLHRIDWKQASELIVKFNMGTGARTFHEVFPNHILNVSEDLPDSISKDEAEGREDLTGLETYTIDPIDAKDFDDAISIQKDGVNTIVWVHIADVSHYVHPNDLIDGEARFRGTSVYLPTRVIPMLPRKLSEDLCSLNEGVDRLAMSTRIVISPEMEILEWEYAPTIIQVDKNLSYDLVNDWIEDGREPFLSLHNISNGLEKRGKRLHLNTPERRIRFKGGRDLDIQIKRATKATKLIEELMVLTNECASRFLEEKGSALPFRVHPLPDNASAEKFNAACEVLGLNIRIDIGEGANERTNENGGESAAMRALMSGDKIDLGNVQTYPAGDETKREDLTHPSEEGMGSAVDAFNDALGSIRELEPEDLRDILNMRLLRTMAQAFYSTENIGHFGLRSMSYCHFTSPIRRYPDILVHRAIKAILSDEGKGPLVGWYTPTTEEVDDVLEHVNDMADSAEDWERDMIDVALATRLRMTPELYKGSHSGMITSITPSSCYILLDDGVTEGRISLRDMSQYRLTVDEHECRILLELGDDPKLQSKFFHERSGDEEELVFLKLGDKVRCTISSVSVAEGHVNLNFQKKV